MKILITGGTGFIGSHLVHSLLQNGHELFILARQNSKTWRIDDIKEEISLLPYSNFDDIEKVFENGFDGVIHLATLYKKNDDISAIPEMIEANVSFPSVLLQQAAKSNCRFFINTGTCFEYKLSSFPLTEGHPTDGYNFYAATKLAFEQILQYTSSHSSLRTATLRLFYPYGEKDNRKLITLLMDAFINCKPITVSKGEQQINYTYISDLVDAYNKSLIFITSDKYKQHEVFNIGIDQTVSIKEIVTTLEDITGKQSIVTFGDTYPEGEIMHMNCNYSKAKEYLGWQPANDIKKGLQHIYDYYKSHPDQL